MRVVTHPAALDACRLYRLDLPVRALNDPDIFERYDQQYMLVMEDTLDGTNGPRRPRPARCRCRRLPTHPAP